MRPRYTRLSATLVGLSFVCTHPAVADTREAKSSQCESVTTKATSAPAQVHFSAAHQTEKRGRVDAAVPEVYELIHVAIALTDTAKSQTNLLHRNSSYYQSVIDQFGAYSQHPFVKWIDSELRQNLFNYFTIKEDSYAFVNVSPDSICKTSMYDRVSDVKNANILDDQIKEMNDFFRIIRFHEFFVRNSKLYAAQSHYFINDINISQMVKWLRHNYPTVEQYDHINIVFSPLTGANQSSNWFSDRGFSELQPQVNFPYPDSEPTGLSTGGEAFFRGRILHTELNHGFLNPASEKYRTEIEQSFSKREIWAIKGSSAENYETSFRLFTEMMNWGLFELYTIDFLNKDDARIVVEINRRDMLDRGFKNYPAFSEKLNNTYRNKKPGQAMIDLYPEIIIWAKQFSNDYK